MLVIQTKCSKFLCGFFENSGKLVYMKKQGATGKNSGSVTEFLERCRVEFPDISKADLIGVTCLGGIPELMKESLIFAKTLDRPIFPLHYLQTHLSFMKNTPSLILGCTSNQTELILSKSFNNYTILGISIDMNLGKVYQKLSSISDMNYKKIENAVMHEFIDIPVPMKSHKGFDFSFSGPYHSTLQHIYPSVTGIKKIPYTEPLFRLENHEGISSLLASFQVSIIDQLERRISKAIEWSIKENPEISTLGFCGGVANNYKIAQSLQKVCEKYGWTLKVPINPSTNVHHLRDCLELMKTSGYNFDMRRVNIKCYENYPLGPFLFYNN